MFNPFAKTSQRAVEAMTDAQQSRGYPQQAIERGPTPLYSYPSSYEHTLLPSGLRLASPFGSPVPSPRTCVGFNHDQVSAQGRQRSLIEGSWDPESGERVISFLEGRWLQTHAEDDANNEESSSSEDSRFDHERSDYGTGTKIITRPACDEDEDYCQVFAKTTTFDPFAADEYAPDRLTSVTPSIKLPTVGCVADGKKAGSEQEDSARRMDEARGMREKERDGSNRDAYFCGSSRYLMVSRTVVDIDVEEKRADFGLPRAGWRSGLGLRSRPTSGMYRGEYLPTWQTTSERSLTTFCPHVSDES